MVKFVGIGGVARAGKDTLFSILKQYFLSKLGQNVERVALADNLKRELDPIFIQHFGISAFTQDTGEKALVREIIVPWARLKRTQSQGKYWTSLVKPHVETLISNNIVPVITDIRYDLYEEDETNWVLNQGGFLIHIQRQLKDGSLVLPANKDEEENDPKVRAKAHLKLTIPTFEDLNDLRDYLFEQFNASIPQ